LKTLHIMDLDFNYKASIRGYEDVILYREWNGIGMLEFTISDGVANSGLIRENDVVWFDREYNKAHLIEHIQIEQLGSTKTLKIKAKHLNTLLGDYITIPPVGTSHDTITGTREQIVRGWVNNNIVNPTDASRKQYNIVLGTLKGLGESITEQTRYKPLSDEIERVLSPQDLGYALSIDLTNKQFIFDVIEGKNRSADQTINNRVIFGMHYGNMANYKRVMSSVNSKSVAYVGGQGEGAARTIEKIDASTSRKKEVFVDARDTNVSTELIERGNQKLSEVAKVDTYEFDIIERQFAYGIDYNLGDFVTIVDDRNNFVNLQLKRVTERFERGHIFIVPEFGNPEQTLSKVIGRIKNRLNVAETQ